VSRKGLPDATAVTANSVHAILFISDIVGAEDNLLPMQERIYLWGHRGRSGCPHLAHFHSRGWPVPARLGQDFSGTLDLGLLTQLGIMQVD